MAGKPYSMREMKSIVDYLVEHKAYGEIKARKMWMDFASSQMTQRTWQSLKETFLKRILPDITNPYYKLSIEQIGSFRSGIDIQAKQKNKLLIEETTSVTKNTSNGIKTEEENLTGEDIISKTLSGGRSNRSSTNTVVLDDVYETAEEIMRVLESPTTVSDDEKTKNSSVKTLRDCIMYTEPLTPMVQEVLDDFASESEGEPQLQIVEDNNDQESQTPNVTEAHNNSDDGSNMKDLVEDSSNVENIKQTTDSIKKIHVSKPFRVVDIPGKDIVKESAIPATGADNTENISNDVSSNIEVSVQNDSQTDKDTEKTTSIQDIITKKSISSEQQNEIPTEDCVNNSKDTIPNNQDDLQQNESNTISNIIEISNVSSSNNDFLNKSLNPRKRSNSEPTLSNIKIKKKKVEEKEEINKIIVKANNITDHQTDVVQANNTAVNDIEEDQTKNVVQSEIQTDDTNKVNNATVDEAQNQNVSNLTSTNTNVSANGKEVDNLCFKSVSLYAEQFNTNQISDNSSEIENSINQASAVNEKVDSLEQDVNVFIPHTESDNSKNKDVRLEMDEETTTSKAQRHRGLANVFGFCSGAVSSKCKSHLIPPKRKSSHRHYIQEEDDSGSSEWVSESDSEFYMSPRRRRRRCSTRKYLKPKSLRIHSLEEEGGLFVMYGKKIFPIVKSGKNVKTLLTYQPESESEDENASYWKQKYKEQKRQLEELKVNSNKLSNGKSTKRLSSEDTEPKILPQQVPNENVEKMKITFKTFNNQELQLEGLWPQIHPVLSTVVDSVFLKTTNVPSAGQKEPTQESIPAKAIASKAIPSSRDTTPSLVVTEMHTSVDMIEKEIFEEIERRDQEEVAVPQSEATHVTVRKPRSPKQKMPPASLAQTPAKKAKLGVSQIEQANTSQRSLNEKPVQSKVAPTRRSLRIQDKHETMNTSMSDGTPQTRTKRKVNEPKEIENESTSQGKADTSSNKKNTKKSTLGIQKRVGSRRGRRKRQSN